MKIVVAGTGYVGLSLAILLSQKNSVTAVDIIKDKVNELNQWKSPIQDDYIEKYFLEAKEGKRCLNLHAVWNNQKSGNENPSNAYYADADIVVIATPTNYDTQKNFFDTSAVETVIDQVMGVNDHCFMIIKSTIPVGYTESMRHRYNTNRILFSPEFLRESKALYDNLYPSRIIVGWDVKDSDVVRASKLFANAKSAPCGSIISTPAAILQSVPEAAQAIMLAPILPEQPDKIISVIFNILRFGFFI